MQTLSEPEPKLKNFVFMPATTARNIPEKPDPLFRSGLFYGFCIAFLIVLSGNFAVAQTPCKTGCTSNDVQIKSAYLMQDRNGTALQSCASGTPVQAYLYLELITNTPRVGVSITANIFNKANQTLVQAVGECFSQSLSSSGNAVTIVMFTNPVAWTCGTQIELKDVLIGWGTGSSNFCVGSAAQCPATSSKCWKQSATTYIPVVTFPCTAPFVSSQPGNQQKCAGQNASFITTFTEGNPDAAAIQWQVSTDNGSNWSNISAGGVYTTSASTVASVTSKVTTATLSVTGVSTTLSGYRYRTLLTNNTSTHNCGTVTDGAATLTVNTSPVISSNAQPAGLTKCVGEDATFTVSSTGGSPAPGIQWQVKTPGGSFADIPNATAASLTITSVTGSLNGNEYRAILTSGACASVISNAAALAVNTPPSISSSPSGITKCAGAGTSFTVGFSGGSPAPGIQWQVKEAGSSSFVNLGNSGIYSGATTSTLNLSAVATNLSGNQYRAVLTSGVCAVVNSSAATLTVDATPTTATAGISQIRCGTLTSADLGGNNTSFIGTGGWTKKSGPGTVTFSNSAAGNAMATVSAVGSYVFTWTISNGTCASSAADISVNYYATPLLAASVNVQPTCAIPSGTISVSSTKTGLAFSINSTTDFSNTTGEFTSLAPGNYTIRARNTASGCEAEPVALTINAIAGAPDAPSIEILEYATPAIATGTIKVLNSITGLEYGAGYEFKNDGYDVTDWTTDPVFTYTAGMGYLIKVRKTNDNTCIVSTTCPFPNSQRQAAPVVNLPVSKSTLTDMTAFPVPFNEKVTIQFTAEKAENYVVNLYDLQGKLIRELKTGNAHAGELISIEVSGVGMRESMYLARKISKSGISTVKLLKKE